MQNFTFVPGGKHHAADPGFKQEHWGVDHILYQLPSQDGASFDSCAHLHYPASSSLPLQASVMFPQTSSAPNLTPVQKEGLVHAQTSASPVQLLSAPCSVSFGRPLDTPSSSSSNPFSPPADSQKEFLDLIPGELLNIKQEPEEQSNLESLGLQEITLDDCKKLNFYKL